MTNQTTSVNTSIKVKSTSGWRVFFGLLIPGLPIIFSLIEGNFIRAFIVLPILYLITYFLFFIPVLGWLFVPIMDIIIAIIGAKKTQKIQTQTTVVNTGNVSEQQNINSNNVVNNTNNQNNQELIASGNNETADVSKPIISEEQKEKMKETFDNVKEKSLDVFEKTKKLIITKKEELSPKINKLISDLKTRDYKSIIEKNKSYIDLGKKIVLPIIAIVVLYFVGSYVYSSMYYNYIPKKGDILVNKGTNVKQITYYNLKDKDIKGQSLVVNGIVPDDLVDNIDISNIRSRENISNGNDSDSRHGAFASQRVNTIGIYGGNSSDDTNTDIKDNNIYGYIYLKTNSSEGLKKVYDEDSYKSLTKELLKKDLEFNYDINKEKHTAFMSISSIKDDVYNLYSMEKFKKLNGFTKQNTILSMVSYADKEGSKVNLSDFLDNFKSALSKANLDTLKFIVNGIKEGLDYSYDVKLLLFAVDREKNKYEFRFKIKLLEDSDDKFYSKLDKKICGFIKSNKPDEVNKLKCDIDVSKKEIEGNVSFLFIK